MAATAGVINGGDFFLFDSKTLIAHSTKHTLTLSMETYETSDKDSSGWTELGPGKRKWSASGDGLYSFDAAYGFSQLMSVYTNRTKVMVKLATTNVSNKYYYGYGYLTSLTADAPSESETTYSYTFDGTAALTEGTGT